jgi:Cdc6-like AAA superfamily ATPase
MVGDTGSGKTMTTAYVVDSLLKSKHVVCCYYCREDHSMTDILRVYRSFHMWQKEVCSTVEPTHSEPML